METVLHRLLDWRAASEKQEASIVESTLLPSVTISILGGGRNGAGNGRSHPCIKSKSPLVIRRLTGIVPRYTTLLGRESKTKTKIQSKIKTELESTSKTDCKSKNQNETQKSKQAKPQNRKINKSQASSCHQNHDILV